MNADLLPSTFLPLLRKSLDRFALFVGRGSQSFRDKMAAAQPELAARIAATGELPSEEAIAHIASCDLLIQPYPDGASSRRTSLMAGLALGVPTVTNRGILSEPMWGTESSGVAVVESPEPAALAAAAEAVLALTPEERSAFGSAASAWYRSRFAPELTISRLRSPRPEAPLQSKST
jgi:glycosyltransferase involved in cell wall biosynthesis